MYFVLVATSFPFPSLDNLCQLLLLLLSIKLRLRADELVQQLDVGQMVTVVGVPVLDTSRKVVMLEAR